MIVPGISIALMAASRVSCVEKTICMTLRTNGVATPMRLNAVRDHALTQTGAGLNQHNHHQQVHRQNQLQQIIQQHQQQQRQRWTAGTLTSAKTISQWATMLTLTTAESGGNVPTMAKENIAYVKMTFCLI